MQHHFSVLHRFAISFTDDRYINGSSLLPGEGRDRRKRDNQSNEGQADMVHHLFHFTAFCFADQQNVSSRPFSQPDIRLRDSETLMNPAARRLLPGLDPTASRSWLSARVADGRYGRIAWLGINISNTHSLDRKNSDKFVPSGTCVSMLSRLLIKYTTASGIAGGMRHISIRRILFPCHSYRVTLSIFFLSVLSAR